MATSAPVRAAAFATVRAAAAAVGVALLLGACAAATADQGDGPPAAAASADFGPDGPGPSDRPDPALTGQPVPTRPAGDPDASDAPDRSGEPARSDQPGPADDGSARTVPESALVDAQTVGDLAGGAWSVDPEPVEACASVAPPGATAGRSLSLTAAGGHLVQTVSAHPGVRAANDAVPATADRLAGCGFTPAGDPRLGQASAALTRTSAAGGEEVAVVIAAEGVSVVLVASGSAAAAGVWESLADVALGSSCAAGVHGCH